MIVNPCTIFGSSLPPPAVYVFTAPAVEAETMNKISKQAPKPYMDTEEPYIDWIPAFGAYKQKTVNFTASGDKVSSGDFL